MHKNWDNTILGHAELSTTELKLETNSVTRADWLRERIEKACVGLLSHRLRTHSDPVAQLEQHRREDPRRPLRRRKPQELPPEMLELLRQEKRSHYESWLDQPLPALGGKTPRQAAQDPRRREELALLFKEIAHRESQQPTDERIDVTDLQHSLGL
jgi:hypothetical protein